MTWHKTSRHSRGYGSEWVKLRRQILLRDHYMCQMCKAKGKVKAGRIVDHIKPKAFGGTDDPENLQTLCEACDKRKQLTDRGYKPKQSIGLDGWPRE